MNSFKNINYIKSKVNILRNFNRHINPSILKSPSYSHCATSYIVKASAFNINSSNFPSRYFSTSIPLNKQETIKVEKDDYTVYMTNSKESLPSSGENVSNSANNTLTSNEAFTIPEPPPLPSSQASSEILPTNILDSVISESGIEPSLASIGLGGWTPPGIAEQLLHTIYVSTGLPWWGTIALTTAILRIFVFPAVIASQKNAIRLRNTMPKFQKLQQALSDAQAAGDKLETMKISVKIAKYVKEKKIDPKRQLIPVLVQAPIFVSFFFGLRSMANVPVASFQEGGMAWFRDLTIADPYYILPLLTSLTLYTNIRLGSDFTIISKHHQLIKNLLLGFPAIVFFLVLNMPSAVLCYWVTNNFFTLGQILFLKLQPVREFLRFPLVIKHEPHQVLPQNKKNFIERGKEVYHNMKKNRIISNMDSSDDMQFKRAGLGPVPKTYAYDPTKVHPRRTYSTLVDSSDFAFRIH